MLAYLATKSAFLRDAPVIEDVVAKSVQANLGIKVGQNEYQSWRNSLGNAMAHVMLDSGIPDDVVVAIEYRLNGRKFRIDFLVAGRNDVGVESIVIIELKQWTDVKFSPLNDHVRTFVGGADRDVLHPSYQAHSYASHLRQFNEYVYENNIQIASCAYLHNCLTPQVVYDERFNDQLAHTPVYVKGDVDGVKDMIRDRITSGVEMALLKKIDSSPIRPSKQLADAAGSMLQGNEEFVLIDDQKTVLEMIVATAVKGQVENKQVLIIKGGPGTGKSVIAMNALARLTNLRMNVKYVTPNQAPREVFKEKLKDTKGIDIGDLFSGSGSFTQPKADQYDALIVDEAHRLKLRHQYAKGGVNQILEVMTSARTTVFFIDEAQKVTWKDIGEIEAIRNFAKEIGAEIQEAELRSQFRCSGSDDYMVWLDTSLGLSDDEESYFSPDRFDFRIVDSPVALKTLIDEKNEQNGRSRVVAGYCWDWVSKNSPSKADLIFPEFEFEATWNLSSHGQGWIIQPDSHKQVGCIHTCQGLELDYVGVIVGPDLIVDNGKLVSVPGARAKTDTSLHGYKKALKNDPVWAADKADEIIKNTYRTLMSRGMKGCYVWFTDPMAAEFFQARLPVTTDKNETV
jgi:DUF2075 family protein/archaellum biogenesis ATPase FlaH